MKAAGLALKEDPHTLRVPRSQRGGEARAATAVRRVVDHPCKLR